MHYLEVILIGTILFFPIMDLINDKFKSSNKNIEYIKITISLWVPTVLLGYLFYTDNLSVVSFNYIIKANWQNILSFTLLLFAVVYLVVLSRTIKVNEKLKSEVAQKFQPFLNLMPVTKSQMLIFTLILSVSAGICEELIFRAYLYSLLDTYMGITGAIILSSIVFGFWHIYLGWQEALRTSIMGGIFCGIYIFTGNIIIPIILHIFIDIYSGLICYFSMQKSGFVAVAQKS
jgi:membrane protease YdiL (CAAX protease family)